MATEKELKTVIGRILKDIRIGIGDEFDQNFERQAFFTKAWARRRSPLRPGGHILVDTGALRKSISSRSDESSITFYSDLPYAAIHNEGGEIKVTARMKRYFWAKYNEAQGGFARKKNGELLWVEVSMTADAVASEGQPEHLLAIDEALTKLAGFNPRLAQLVGCR